MNKTENKEVPEKENEEDNTDELCFQAEEPETIFKKLCLMQLVILAVALVWGYFANIFWWKNILKADNIIWTVYLAVFLLIISSITYNVRWLKKIFNLKWIVQNIYFPVFGGLVGWQFAVLSLASGLCEEAFFRGVLCEQFGVIVPSLIFGALHISHKKMIPSGIWTACLGLVFGYVYLYTGNLAVTVIVHCLNNFVMFLSLKKLFILSLGED